MRIDEKRDYYMIITKEVKIKVNGRNKKHFNDLGYTKIKLQQIINVPVTKLMKNSKSIIKIKCDNCEIEKEIRYSTYNLYTNNLKIDYLCNKCNKKRAKETFLKKYGVDNPQKCESVKNKTKETCLEKYGVDNPSKNESIIKKIKETFKEKYKHENCFQNEEIKEKIKNKLIEKYGVEHPMYLKETKEKIKQTCLKKYGHLTYTLSDEYKIKRGFNLDKDIEDKWKLYKKQSRRIFDKIKTIVFEKWDGYDYYDDEYIKNYLELEHTDPNYPTIDHKISLHYGFNNNVPVDEINKIENLVITKRSINSSKGIKNEKPD
jgi:hypothetical protein